MRATFAVVAVLSPVLFAACQDSYASNSERDTHMGDIRAAAPSAAAPRTPGFVAPPPGPNADHVEPMPAPSGSVLEPAALGKPAPRVDAGPAKGARPGAK